MHNACNSHPITSKLMWMKKKINIVFKKFLRMAKLLLKLKLDNMPNATLLTFNYNFIRKYFSNYYTTKLKERIWTFACLNDTHIPIMIYAYQIYLITWAINHGTVPLFNCNK